MLGGADLDQLLAERERLNEQLQQIIDEQTEPWGIKVSTVEIKDVEIPEAMQRAMARQAEAERERRAKIINAEGEFQAAEKLADAAAILGREPAALQLRYLQTLLEIGGRAELHDRLPAAARPASRRSSSARDAGARPTAARPRPVDVDPHPLPARRRARVLRRRPAHARGRRRPVLRGQPADAGGRATLRHRQPRRARRADRDRGGDGRPLARWSDGLLQIKLMLVVLIGVLVALHVATPESRAVAIGVLAATLLAVWLGVTLSH